MEYRELGESGIPVSALTFGAWAIGDIVLGGTDRANAIEALRKAYELGYTSIDTAPIYLFGYSEQVVAEAISDLPRDKVQIFTKCGQIWEGERGVFSHTFDYYGNQMRIYRYAGKESIIKECEDSLRRLKTDYIDLYSLHWPRSITPGEETMEAFIRLKEQGKIRAAGVCNHTAEEMKQAEEDICITANKLVYGMLDRRIEKDVIPYCLEKKKSILAYRSLQRGLLTGRDLPKFLGPAEPYREVAFYEPENISRIRSFLDNIRPIANDHGADVTQLCIRWAMDQAGISAVLLAASSAEQIVYDAKAMDILLSEGEMNAIDGFLAELESTLELEPKAEALAANPS